MYIGLFVPCREVRATDAGLDLLGVLEIVRVDRFPATIKRELMLTIDHVDESAGAKVTVTAYADGLGAREGTTLGEGDVVLKPRHVHSGDKWAPHHYELELQVPHETVIWLYAFVSIGEETAAATARFPVGLRTLGARAPLEP